MKFAIVKGNDIIKLVDDETEFVEYVKNTNKGITYIKGNVDSFKNFVGERKQNVLVHNKNRIYLVECNNKNMTMIETWILLNYKVDEFRKYQNKFSLGQLSENPVIHMIGKNDGDKLKLIKDIANHYCAKHVLQSHEIIVITKGYRVCEWKDIVHGRVFAIKDNPEEYEMMSDHIRYISENDMNGLVLDIINKNDLERLTNKKIHKLIIFDCCIDEIDELDSFNELYFNGKYHNIGIIVNSIYPVKIPISYIKNVSYVFLGSDIIKTNRADIYYDYLNIKNFSKYEDFETIYDLTTKEYGDFLVINNINGDTNDKLFWYQNNIKK